MVPNLPYDTLKEQRVAIGRGFGDRSRADHAGPVVNARGLVQGRPQVLSDDPRHGIGVATRREGDDEL